jgi:molybdopterin-guanine dinucleotide biosynthesis protein A
MIDASVIILAGGKNSRMNYMEKSQLKLDNDRFIDRILREVKGFSQIIISTNNPENYDSLGAQLVMDSYKDFGPLCGIHAGLEKSCYKYSVVVAVDAPFLNRQILEYLYSLASNYDVIVPKIKEQVQPLCGVYSKECLPYIEANLNNNIKKIMDLYKSVNVRYVTEELVSFGNIEDIFRNINTPEDYKLYCSNVNFSSKR